MGMVHIPSACGLSTTVSPVLPPDRRSHMSGMQEKGMGVGDHRTVTRMRSKTKHREPSCIPHPGEIWWTSMYEGIKDRPVLIIRSNKDDVTIRRCTSKDSTEFHRDLIEDYYEAGLEKPTFVDEQMHTIPKSKLVKRMGRLSEYDRPRFGFPPHMS